MTILYKIIINHINIYIIKGASIFKRKRKLSENEEKEENLKISDFLKNNKTEKTYAFSLDEISKGTGIKHVNHDRIIKVGNIDWARCYGKIFYSYDP